MRTFRVPLLFSIVLLWTRLACGADNLPAKLSDSEFWQLVSDLSEPNGQFQYENFVSNEYNLQWVIPSLAGKTGPASAYIGVGPEQNFTYISALHPKIAFIIDIRRQNLLEHLMYKALFDLSRNRADFIALLFSLKPQPASTESTAGELFTPYQRLPTRFSYLLREILKRCVHRSTVNHKFALSEEKDQTDLRYVYSTFSQHGPALDYYSRRVLWV